MKKKVSIEIISTLLAILFIYAAVSKLTAYDTFRVSLGQSPFITSFAGIIAWALPVIEISISFALAFPGVRFYGLYASLFLLSTFTAYLVAMLNFSYYIPCSCGGILASLSWKQHIVFNSVFILLCVTGIHLLAIENDIRKLKYT